MQFPFQSDSLFFFLYHFLWRPILSWKMQINRKRKQRIANEKEKRQLHELPYTGMVKSWTVGLAAGQRDIKYEKYLPIGVKMEY